MMSCAGLAVSLGLFLVYLLGAITDWRTVSLICSVFPLITLISLLMVSHWLFAITPTHSTLIEWFCRCLRRRFGCYRKVAKKTRENRCNGFVAGFIQKRSNVNSTNCSATKKHHARVLNARSTPRNALTHRRRWATKSAISSASVRSNLSSSSWWCFSCCNSAVCSPCDHTSCRSWTRMAYHFRRAKPRPCSVCSASVRALFYWASCESSANAISICTHWAALLSPALHWVSTDTPPQTNLFHRKIIFFKFPPKN